MGKNRTLMTAAIILVLLQFLCFFFPSYSRVKNEKRVETYSTMQLLINYSDILDGPDEEELETVCFLGRLFTCGGYISAVIFLVGGIRKEKEDGKSALNLVASASMDLTAVSAINLAFLFMIFDEFYTESHPGFPLLLFFQLLAGIIVLILSKCYDEGYAASPSEGGKIPTAQELKPEEKMSEEFYVEPVVVSGTLTCPVCNHSGMKRSSRHCERCGTAFIFE